MDVLRTARFSTLFAVAFAVGAAFLLGFILLGVALSFVAPAFFTLNGERATNAGQALLALLIVGVMLAFLNAGISALGSLVWLGVRKLLFRPTAA